jgi:FAD binding domain
MRDRYDVAIVGSRCAGAALAAYLARTGIRVAAFDQDPMPSDCVLSTNTIHPPGVDVLDELGVGARVGETTPAGAITRLENDGVYPDRVFADGQAEYCPRRSPSTAALFDSAPIAAFAGAFLGCLTTLAFSAFGIVPCIASALATALLCGLLFFTRTPGLFADAFSPAVYGGTFGGMTPIVWLSDGAFCHPAILTGLLLISLSSVCGLAFSVVAKLDIRSVAPFGSGYGGRLGAIAAAASFLFVESVGRLGADVGRFHGIPTGASGVESWAVPLGFFSSLGGILCTMFALRQRRTATAGVATRIFNASVVALIGLLTMHVGNPDDTPTLEAFYAGCFLGMSTPERLKGPFQPLFGAVVLTAMLVLVRAFLPGVGGGLGLAAFLTAALLVALTRVTVRIRQSANT